MRIVHNMPGAAGRCKRTARDGTDCNMLRFAPQNCTMCRSMPVDYLRVASIIQWQSQLLLGVTVRALRVSSRNGTTGEKLVSHRARDTGFHELAVECGQSMCRGARCGGTVSRSGRTATSRSAPAACSARERLERGVAAALATVARWIHGIARDSKCSALRNGPTSTESKPRVRALGGEGGRGETLR